MTRAETYGHRFSMAVADYLKTNGLKSLGQINGRILAELAQDFNEKDKLAAKRVLKMADEEEWLKTIEADPIMRCLDVRQELGKMKFWCKQNNADPTRRRFTKWLMKAINDGKVQRAYDGATSRPTRPQPPKPKYSLETPVPSWPMLLRNYIPLSLEETERLCALDWHELPVTIREKIIQAA